MRLIIGRGRQGLEQPLDLTERKRASAAAGAIKTVRRSGRYLEALAKLDVGVGEHADVGTVIDPVAAEFGAGDRLPLGLLAQCYLGAPYEVHVLDLGGGIVRHYEVREPLEHQFELGRRLAVHPAYVAIEIYSDHLVCIHADGRASEVAT